MGNIESSGSSSSHLPNTLKSSHETNYSLSSSSSMGREGTIACGVSSMQGWRKTMEVIHINIYVQ